jgi:hypothetical protein
LGGRGRVEPLTGDADGVGYAWSCGKKWFRVVKGAKAMSTPARPASSAEPALTEEEKRQRQIELNQPAIALLKSWMEDDSESVEEQRAALFELMRGIDENRKGYRQLFQHLLNENNDDE